MKFEVFPVLQLTSVKHSLHVALFLFSSLYPKYCHTLDFMPFDGYGVEVYRHRRPFCASINLIG